MIFRSGYDTSTAQVFLNCSLHFAKWLLWTDEDQPASNVMLLCIRGINPIVINPNVQCPKKLKETSTQRIHYQRHIFFTLLSPPLVYEVGVGLLVGGSATNDSVCVAFAVPFVP